ncbi:MAG: hypothetical protein FJX48_13160 [Alphaproteobacteria bacterium]|nr:hypothetical protein [Alphaproteobacteria bacterium]
MMIRSIFAMFCLLAGAAQAAEKNMTAEEIKAHARQHREFADIHLQAAQCLEAGKPYKECDEALKKACKGKASGPHCGMRHKH